MLRRNLFTPFVCRLTKGVRICAKSRSRNTGCLSMRVITCAYWGSSFAHGGHGGVYPHVTQMDERDWGVSNAIVTRMGSGESARFIGGPFTLPCVWLRFSNDAVACGCGCGLWRSRALLSFAVGMVIRRRSSRCRHA